MPGSKRFTYQTGDGKRHWVRAYCLALPEGVQFCPAESPPDGRKSTATDEAMISQKNERPGLALDLSLADDHNPGTLLQSTIHQE